MKRLKYLLSVYTFPEEEITTNTNTLTWPNKVPSLFEQNEVVMDMYMYSNSNSNSQCTCSLSLYTCTCIYFLDN